MRSVSQIYAEAVTVRNNYLQLTTLNSGRSNSKLSILNLLTYVVAVCIHTYETILDIFQVKMAEVLLNRINGTPDWYVMMVKRFQYDNAHERGDELFFNEDTLKIEYVTPNTSNRIVEQAAWDVDNSVYYLTIKVCKANSNTSEAKGGNPYSPLSSKEMTALKQFIQEIKFVGADVYCESLPGDILYLVADENAPIFYNDSFVTAEQALEEIKQVMLDYVNNLQFNEYVYYQSIIDCIQKAEHISDISQDVQVYTQSYDNAEERYNSQKRLRNRIKPKSGFIRILDSNGKITINTDNITLVPVSRIDEYSTISE